MNNAKDKVAKDDLPLIEQKLKSLHEYSMGAVSACSYDSSRRCLEELSEDFPSFLGGAEPSLTIFEHLLQRAIHDTEGYANKLDINQPWPSPSNSKGPSFRGVLERKLASYLNKPSNNALQTLETAINIAFMQNNRQGDELFLELSHRDELGGSKAQGSTSAQYNYYGKIRKSFKKDSFIVQQGTTTVAMRACVDKSTCTL
ncbi:hypothetical protein [Pseudobacteriovorax antillogorgiicola]|uniref:Uncharacterized protein n=1 Tax=Pseudobacteriovorax antillogorgiicola TaxID=1513793 RepID=A0A1Y6BRE4_9BACT|nr:hypothetical protein [Pseudobacteriovorax antillogorgiicola]TCS54721.1 hypothetical protein EDD56_106234 [Pseudobacteriovorax antillogorgiicola]SMF16012.1 hypothetical protein SAMN06296036_1069 [Pseudobacteriovorax antillogorgiicola]